ncbi:acylneuraminate cytidylyltransferase family protein [Parerythrobacter jejuensis]|uniref:NTP transferase domain-containing protein n=1 Tax=Parerythrobacter jejuensis TaxID=795812 RepID=A0A845AVU7_9SPHN|nr:acylneuraminate cytidylyltransferase family protein [Parerythrobacter jejuensis]MXP30889.1 NTP transferase domain-containing protein [Parerythrobacter jejuensis]MXP33649.1 NTP transferase domain-containing protein [Parerythrobacter jejuensis]
MTLALITARGGSKGIPRKNIRMIAGKPLIAWTIEAALSSRSIARVVVSTEDEEIASVARQYGADVPFMRPAELADDNASSQSVVAHACEQLPEYKDLVLLQPTSPLRTSEHIEGILELSRRTKTLSATSVTEVRDHPAIMYHCGEAGDMVPYAGEKKATRRQDLEQLFSLNGALYWVSVAWFLEHRALVSQDTRAYIMEAEDSVDVDDMLDWKFAEMLLRARHKSSQ